MSDANARPGPLKKAARVAAQSASETLWIPRFPRTQSLCDLAPHMDKSPMTQPSSARPRRHQPLAHARVAPKPAYLRAPSATQGTGSGDVEFYNSSLSGVCPRETLTLLLATRIRTSPCSRRTRRATARCWRAWRATCLHQERVFNLRNPQTMPCFCMGAGRCTSRCMGMPASRSLCDGDAPSSAMFDGAAWGAAQRRMATCIREEDTLPTTLTRRGHFSLH
jgi:hypothetical protein